MASNANSTGASGTGFSGFGQLQSTTPSGGLFGMSRTQVGTASTVPATGAFSSPATSSGLFGHSNSASISPSNRQTATPSPSLFHKNFGSHTPGATPTEVAKKRYDYDDDFTVLVGKDEVRYTIHKDVFSHQSDFFRAAFAHDFKESKEKTIRMPDADPNAFRSYMQWAYRGEVVVMSPEEIGNDPVPFCAKQQLRLGELFTLANFLGDLRLRNGVTDKIIKLSKFERTGPSIDLISHLYAHAPDDCKLRKYVLDWYLHNPTGDSLEKHRSVLPPAFLGDMAIGWAKSNFDRSKFVDPHAQSPCFYHERGTLLFCPCACAKV